MRFCPQAWFPAHFPASTPQLEKLCSQLEGASKTHTYVFLQSSNLLCFDRGSSHLYQLSEQLPVVASKLQDTGPNTGIKGTSLCPGNTYTWHYRLSVVNSSTNTEAVASVGSVAGEVHGISTPLPMLLPVAAPRLASQLVSVTTHFCLWPLVPSHDGSFKATDVSWWVCFREASPVAGVVFYLCDKGICRERPFGAAC